MWVTGNYDPETNLSFWGTGNGGPWMGDQRPGDNLYVASTVAIDVATGQIKGHFQYNPNESWDWDEVSPPLLIDYQRNGRTIKGLVNVARDGYLWFLERTSGKINFVEGKPYVMQNVFRGLDPKTGKPDVDPAHKPGTGKRAEFCPGSHGGKNWPPIAFSPQTRMIYIPANNNLCGALMGVPVEYTPGKGFAGTQFGGPGFAAPGADHVGGEVQAWNVDTGQRVWRHRYEFSPNWGSMLATAGGVVFSGGTNDRKVHAFDAASGKLLWEFVDQLRASSRRRRTFTDGRQAVPRRALRLGRRRPRNERRARPHVSRQGPRAARGRRHLGLRVAVNLFAREDADVAELDCGRIRHHRTRRLGSSRGTSL